MSENHYAAPPPYMDVVGKYPQYVPGERAGAYVVPPQELIHDPNTVKYPSAPLAYAVQGVPLTTFAKNPVQCCCPNCQSLVVTRVEQTSGLLAWLICLFLVIFGCWLGCCLIPFCVSDLQNVQHYCPNCNAFIGEYRPL
ncbi:unnamed protein product [Adineta ricciae]|uniref:LITAF domain-containing protein n=1 Tax=Adineta ricciae TaxID=249248 RepID=A0A814GBV9_ADIRI|nr:unnamed protein product [Adineta ricciae]CAF1048772.1 unnamed protein product [Adineta ricciae]